MVEAAAVERRARAGGRWPRERQQGPCDDAYYLGVLQEKMQLGGRG